MICVWIVVYEYVVVCGKLVCSVCCQVLCGLLVLGVVVIGFVVMGFDVLVQMVVLGGVNNVLLGKMVMVDQSCGQNFVDWKNLGNMLLGGGIYVLINGCLMVVGNNVFVQMVGVVVGDCVSVVQGGVVLGVGVVVVQGNLGVVIGLVVLLSGNMSIVVGW